MKHPIFYVLTIFTIGSGHSRSEQPYNAKLVLYKGLNCKSEKVGIVEQYEPYLHNIDKSWNNGACSVEVTGVWLLYDFGNYNSMIGNAGVEYIFGPNQSCENLENLRKKASSVRFAGDVKDYRVDSLTLFVETYFQGEEEFTLGDLANIILEQQASLIITGTSGWTLYNKANYEGGAVCVFPPNSTHSYSPAFVFDIKKVLQVSYNSIRSVRRGCFDSDYIFTMEERFHGTHNVTR